MPTIRRKMLIDRVSQVVRLKRFVHYRKSVERWRVVAGHEYQGDAPVEKRLADWRAHLPAEVQVDQSSIDSNGLDELERLVHGARCSC